MKTPKIQLTTENHKLMGSIFLCLAPSGSPVPGPGEEERAQAPLSAILQRLLNPVVQ